MNSMNNSTITDKTGKQIAKAIRIMAGSGEDFDIEPEESAPVVPTDSQILICHSTETYPGDGADPYAGQYEPISSSEGEDEATSWLDVPFNKIFEALAAGKLVYILVHGVEESKGALIAYSQFMPIYEAMKIVDNTLSGPMEVRFNNEDKLVRLYAKNETDYPCSRNMVWDEQH